MSVIWFRTKIYKYNKNDEKVYLKKSKHRWYHIMEVKDVDQFIFDYYENTIMKKKPKTHYGLAEYIDEDNPLYKLVNVIDYSVKGTYLVFRVEGSIKEEDTKSIELVKKYIEGQISDGAWENGIYLLDSFIGNKVNHYFVEGDIEQVVKHPYERDENGRELYIPGNYATIDALVDEHITKFKKDLEKLKEETEE